MQFPRKTTTSRGHPWQFPRRFPHFTNGNLRQSTAIFTNGNLRQLPRQTTTFRDDCHGNLRGNCHGNFHGKQRQVATAISIAIKGNCHVNRRQFPRESTAIRRKRKFTVIATAIRGICHDKRRDATWTTTASGEPVKAPHICI